MDGKSADGTPHGAQRRLGGPARAVAQPVQSRRDGFLLWAMGLYIRLVGAVMGMFGFMAMTDPPPEISRWTGLAMGMGGMALLHHGLEVSRSGRQHLTKIIRFPGELTRTPFVLYLRSFDDDQARSRMEGPYGWDTGGLLYALFLSTRTEEEQIAAALCPAGQVVAVGRPGQELPETGAHRMYLPHDDWQDTIVDLMTMARLVVLSVGDGPGLRWEVIQAVRRVAAVRLVLLVPTASSYAVFREEITHELSEVAEQIGRETGTTWHPPALPELPRRHIRDGLDLDMDSSGLAYVIYFDDDWTPTPIPLVTHSTFGNRRNGVRKAVAQALQPVFKRLPPH